MYILKTVNNILRKIYVKCIFHILSTVTLNIYNLLQHGLYFYILQKDIAYIIMKGYSERENQSQFYETMPKRLLSTVVYPYGHSKRK